MRRRLNMFKQKIKYKRAVFLWMIFLFSTSIQAQQKLSLDDALKMALQNNFSIQIAKNDAEITKINNYAGAAGMLPNVVGTALQDNQTANTNQKYLNGTENNKTAATTNQFNANAELGWTIFDGLKMFATKNRLNELQQIGELRMRSQIEQIFTRIIKAYFDVVLAKRQLKIVTDQKNISESRLQLAKDKLAAGKASKTESLKAQVDLNTDRSLMMRQENIFRNSKSSLNQLLARNYDVDFDVIDTITLREDFVLGDIESKIVSQNAGVLIAKKNQYVSVLAIREINAERAPTIQLKSGYNYSNQVSQAGFLQSSSSNGFHYGAGLNINLFNGFSVNRRLQNAKLTQRTSELVFNDSLLRIQTQVQQAFNTYMVNLKLVGVEKENVNVAQENFDIADEQYKVGVITSIELRDAQQNLLISENRLLTSYYDAKISETELLRLSGELLKLK